MDAKLTLEQALNHIRKKQAAQARPLLVAVLREDPKNAVAWFLLSHVLDDPQRQQYALLQALQADPNFERARQRLQKLHGERPARAVQETPGGPAAFAKEVSPVDLLVAEAEETATAEDDIRASVSPFIELTAEEEPAPKGRPAWLRPVFALVLLGLLAAAVVFGWEYAAGLDLFAAGASPTPVASRTLAPTWTPSVQGTPQAGSAIEEPALQPQFETSPEMEVIAGQLGALRGQQVQALPAALLPQGDFARWLSGELLTEPRLRAMGGEELLLRGLGLLRSEDSLRDYELNHRLDPLGGFYSGGQIYLAAPRFDEAAQFVYARLLAQDMALQRSAEIGNFAANCTPLQDACRALRALVLGEAALLAEEWARSVDLPTPAGQMFIESGLGADFVRADLEFPWQTGRNFVQAAFDDGGWGAVNDLYAKPPLSTEHLLHPEKYVESEAPLALDDADIGALLGSGWEPAGRGALGEWLTYLLLAQGAEAELRLAQPDAAAAAGGWGGDHYQAHRRQADGASALAVHWRMDGAEDAAELAAALGQLLSRRFVDASPLGSGQCWAGGGQRTCLFAFGDGLLWLLGPDEIVLLQVMLAQYPDFQ